MPLVLREETIVMNDNSTFCYRKQILYSCNSNLLILKSVKHCLFSPKKSLPDEALSGSTVTISVSVVTSSVFSVSISDANGSEKGNDSYEWLFDVLIQETNLIFPQFESPHSLLSKALFIFSKETPAWWGTLRLHGCNLGVCSNLIRVFCFHLRCQWFWEGKR